jgi:hypothetical protein
MTTSNPRKGYKSQPVPDLIKQLWTIYFEMSLDPELQVGAAHVRNAALALEHTRRMAFEVAQEQYLMAACETGAEDARQDDEREFAKRNPKFGSVMKH